MITKVINDFSGRLTRVRIGDLNSGYAKYDQTYGADPFSFPGNLSWLGAAEQIGSGVITDLIMAARPRLESGITYVYAIGHTGKLYKIQVNQPSGFDPGLDSAVLLTTLTINSPTFKYGSSIQFYGTTEKLYIGHDMGVTSVNYDGTGEAFVGVLGSWTQNVPRPSAQFNGLSYWGNGANLTEIDISGAVLSYAKFSPPFFSGTITRDLDVSPDGNYLQIIISRLNSTDMTVATQDTTSLSATDSYKLLWSGIDPRPTSYETYGGYTINANMTFGNQNFTMGYDLGGAAVYQNADKILSLPRGLSPNFGATVNTGNLMGFAAPENSGESTGFLTGAFMFYGQYDSEIPKGLFRLLRMSAAGTETDVIQMPVCLIVTNLFYASSSAGYVVNNLAGWAKIYFSSLETSSAPTIKYRFYTFLPFPITLNTYIAVAGVYETQQQTSFSTPREGVKSKFKVSEIRIYTHPLNANNSFKVELVDADSNLITNGGFTFTGGTTAAVDSTVNAFNPAIAPQHSIGVRISNLGSGNWICDKIELDISEAGR